MYRGVKRHSPRDRISEAINRQSPSNKYSHIYPLGGISPSILLQKYWEIYRFLVVTMNERMENEYTKQKQKQSKAQQSKAKQNQNQKKKPGDKSQKI
jgi:hypothetical protein